MTQDEARVRCDMLSDKDRAAVEKHEQRLAEIAEKELELIELENVRQMLRETLDKTGRLLSEGDAKLSSSELAGLRERLGSLPHEILLAEQCIGLLQQVIEKTRALAELEKLETESWMLPQTRC